MALFLPAFAELNSQELTFDWSFGNVSLSYDFIGSADSIDVTILEFNVSLEELDLMISASVLFGTDKDSRSAMDPFFNSPLPLTILYTPFRWRYAHLSAYGRGAWEIGYVWENAKPTRASYGFFGSLGVKAGLIPMKQNFVKYRAYMATLFLEYTTHREFKLGISIDLFYMVYIGVKVWPKKDTLQSNLWNPGPFPKGPGISASPGPQLIRAEGLNTQEPACAGELQGG
jgi:hypothetical protein